MSRARDLASSGVTSTVLSAKAPLASPSFTGDVTLGSTTKLKLGSSGGIYESDGSTAILNESTGAVSLSNSNIGISNTFPAGHVIQSKTDTHNSSAINVTNASFYTTLEVSITFTTNNNMILWWLFVPGVYNEDEINTGINAGMLWSNDNFSTHQAVLGQKQYSMSYEGYLGPPSAGVDVPMLSSISLCEGGYVGQGTNPSAGTAVKIRPVLKGVGGGTPQIFSNGSVSDIETATMIVQEVKQ